MVVHETLNFMFTKIWEGHDIPSPEAVLKVKSDKSAIVPAGHRYSLVQNLAHALLWQDFWLQKLDGGRKKSGMAEWKHDFRVPQANEFEELRGRFLSGLLDARDRCSGDTIRHRCDSDEEAISALLDIAIHASYHLGQMNLIRMALRKSASETPQA